MHSLAVGVGIAVAAQMAVVAVAAAALALAIALGSWGRRLLSRHPERLGRAARGRVAPLPVAPPVPRLRSLAFPGPAPTFHVVDPVSLRTAAFTADQATILAARLNTAGYRLEVVEPPAAHEVQVIAGPALDDLARKMSDAIRAVTEPVETCGSGMGPLTAGRTGKARPA
jgi:hypothetical protein